MNFKADSLRSYFSHVLENAGLPTESAKTVADSLVYANLRGTDSHGAIRLSIYVKRLKAGATNPDPEIRIIKESDATLLIDGDDGMGHVVSAKAMEMGIEKAKKAGTACIGVTRSTHFGVGAFYIQQGIKKDMATFVMSNAPATMAPWGGVQPFLGTNPYAFGIPAGKHDPIILDMATSVAARGKIIAAAQEGKEIPVGWAIDQNGRPTTDPQIALKGSLLPFGEHKGYAISLMVDVMSAMMTGASFGPHINELYGQFDKPQNLGHFFQLIDIKHFISIDIFKQRIDQMIDEIKLSPKAAGVQEIFLPGEIESRVEKERLREGINLSKEVYEDIKNTGKECEVDIENYHN